ncbi:hypothetical protein P3G55_00060 [Leptospira sp. 96542]|nr:hypothetical protein [Leptospira sp. 96542]
MKNKKEFNFKPKDLHYGNLKDILIDRMLPYESLRSEFGKEIEKNKKTLSEDTLINFEQIHGFRPGKEILEWENIKYAYRKVMYQVADIWNMIDHRSMEEEDGYETDDYDYAVSSILFLTETKNIEHIMQWIFGTYSGLMFVLNGSYAFASDGSGDSCWLNLLPNEFESIEVNRYNHEVGDLEDDPYFSISHFIAANWSNSDEQDEEYSDEIEFDEDEEERTKEIRIISQLNAQTLQKFEEDAGRKYSKKTMFLKSYDMFFRSAWLLGHTYGDPVYAFTEKLSNVPSFKTWEEELHEIINYPHLSVYWILAHFYMKNDEACKKTIKGLTKTKSEVVKQLSKTITDYFDKKTKDLFGIPKEKVEKIRDLTFKNSEPKHIEPNNIPIYNEVIGLNAIKTASKKELNEVIKNEGDLFAFIESYPEDVNTHDQILKTISQKDEHLKKIIDEYFRERTDSAYNEWPYKADNLDKRLSTVISAAFRQGLNYSPDNKKAYCGITRTLGKLDDDNSMLAYKEAIEKLNQDDPRLEYVIEGLIESKHNKSKEILALGAWKTFETLENVKMIRDKVIAEGPTLDNLFTVYTHLNTALTSRILVADGVSVQLIEKLYQYQNNLDSFGISAGNAFSVSAYLGLKEHLPIIIDYTLKKFNPKSRDKNSYLDLNYIINISEAVLSWVRLDPESAKPKLVEIFKSLDNSEYPGIKIDLKACCMTGLLYLEPENEEYIRFAKRILQNRGEEVRVYGIIRAIGKKQIRSLKDELWYHIYADPEPMVDYSWSYIEFEARKTWELLTNEEAPAFNGKDKYANSLSKDKNKLAESILHPELYSIQHVFTRIYELKYKHEDVIKIGGPWLVQSLKYSADEYKYSGSNDRIEAIKALFIQGKNVFPYFLEIIQEPFVASSWKSDLLKVMRVMEPEALKWKKVISMETSEIETILSNPTPDWYVWTDLLCVRLFLLLGEKSFELIEQTVLNRLNFTNQFNHSSNIYEETLGLRLPTLLKLFGKKGDDKIQTLWKESKPGSETRAMIDMAARKNINTLSSSLPQLDENGILLTFYPEGREYGWHSWIHLTPDIVKFGMNEFHYHSLLEDSKTQSSMPAAENELSLIWQMASHLGYGVSKKKPKAKK